MDYIVKIYNGNDFDTYSLTGSLKDVIGITQTKAILKSRIFNTDITYTIENKDRLIDKGIIRNDFNYMFSL